MYSVSPRDTERFCLRLLLLHVRGATSYDDLKTVGGEQYDTFKEAAIALNLLDTDENWIKTLEEAAIFQMPSQLRMLLTTIFVFGYPSNAKALYSMFKNSLSEDYANKFDEETAEQLTLRDLEDHLSQFGKTCKEYGLPTPRFTDSDDSGIDEILVNERESTRLLSLLNEEQRRAYEAIISSVYGNSETQCFFLSGAGGCGKTFLYQTLTATLLSRGDKVKSVAPTGLAATLLKHGQTVHSGFRLPLKIDETTVSRITQNSHEFKALKLTKLIIWDEISMCTAKMLDAVDRSLRDLLNSSTKPFGGITIVVGGDFRQQAPVVLHGNRVKVIESSVKSSKLWKSFNELYLVKNMRVNLDEIEFVDWLLRIGAGLDDENNKSDFVKLQDDLLSDNIVNTIFGSDINSLPMSELASRAILCPRNDDTLQINETVLCQLQGELKTYFSVDTVMSAESEEEHLLYPVEFLNSLTPMGLPPHQLNLKVGCCVMLLRNLNPKKGLCNGTRLVVEKLGSNIIDCCIFTGDQKGSRVFIPRMFLDTNDEDIPFQLRRKQFPLRLAYSMIITKSQGQTFEKIGVYLRQPVFTHGQLYTALSRVKSKDGLALQIINGQSQGKIYKNDESVYTYNCVFSELL
ncbi:unnamed protein product [Orchesella dallaii]|uniref:ATP-dependent DNA helicase n=1 Tax=Orchesella dallaii TaxID=48710 RepID=A0ABP1SAU9_9HEXA